MADTIRLRHTRTMLMRNTQTYLIDLPTTVTLCSKTLDLNNLDDIDEMDRADLDQVICDRGTLIADTYDTIDDDDFDYQTEHVEAWSTGRTADDPQSLGELYDPLCFAASDTNDDILTLRLVLNALLVELANQTIVPERASRLLDAIMSNLNGSEAVNNPLNRADAS